LASGTAKSERGSRQGPGKPWNHGTATKAHIHYQFHHVSDDYRQCRRIVKRENGVSQRPAIDFVKFKTGVNGTWAMVAFMPERHKMFFYQGDKALITGRDSGTGPPIRMDRQSEKPEKTASRPAEVSAEGSCFFGILCRKQPPLSN
jgi:hypothetical protein